MSELRAALALAWASRVQPCRALGCPSGEAIQGTSRMAGAWHEDRQGEQGRARAQEEGVQLELSREMSYDRVAAELAAKLGLADPQLLRFTPQNTYSQARCRASAWCTRARV